MRWWAIWSVRGLQHGRHILGVLFVMRRWWWRRRSIGRWGSVGAIGDGIGMVRAMLHVLGRRSAIRGGKRRVGRMLDWRGRRALGGGVVRVCAIHRRRRGMAGAAQWDVRVWLGRLARRLVGVLRRLRMVTERGHIGLVGSSAWGPIGLVLDWRQGGAWRGSGVRRGRWRVGEGWRRGHAGVYGRGRRRRVLGLRSPGIHDGERRAMRSGRKGTATFPRGCRQLGFDRGASGHIRPPP